MDERMHQILDSLRRQIGEESWDTFFEAMYDAFGKHDELEGENVVLFEQVQSLKMANSALEKANDAMRQRLLELTEPDSDGWVELPRDVDGEPICVGDELVDTSDTSHRGKARSIELKEDGWIVFVGSLGRWSHVYRHVKPDTWERIIEDALGSRWSAPDEPSSDFLALVARCEALCERTKGGDGE